MRDDVAALRAELAGLREKLTRSERRLAFTVEHLVNLMRVRSVDEMREVRGGAENWLAAMALSDKPQ